MAVVVSTQCRENYGAHDWDGNGECPQYWKNKGGEDWIILNAPSEEDAVHYVDHYVVTAMTTVRSMLFLIQKLMTTSVLRWK